MIDLELLSSALTIVIADEIIVPEIEVDSGSVKIMYKISDTTVTELSSIFEIEHCMRLDFFTEKVRLNAKHQIYNNLAMRYTHVRL